MVILSVIVGVLLMMGGVACLFSPFTTFLATGYIIAIALLVYGIVGIVNVIRKFASPITLIVDILAIIMGIICLFRPMDTAALDVIVAYLAAAWFVVQGAISIYLSIKARKVKKGWVAGLILGIIGVILGIFSLIHPLVSALAIGILIAIYLIEAGLSLIVMATAVDAYEDGEL